MQQGKIARVTDRGYGFIAQDGGDKDLFFHANELKNAQFDQIKEGDSVTFEIGEGPKGQNAINVNIA